MEVAHHTVRNVMLSLMMRTKLMDDAIETLAREYCKAAARQGFHVDEAACEQRLQLALKATGFAVVPVADVLDVCEDALELSKQAHGDHPATARRRVRDEQCAKRLLAAIAAAKGEA